MRYNLPDTESHKRPISNLLGTFQHRQFPLEKAALAGKGLSHSEIDRACRDAIKLAILDSKNQSYF